MVELLVVVVVISSLLALSIPRFRNTFNNLRFDNFCQDLAARMRYLNERASFEQNIYRMNFDFVQGKIEIAFKENFYEEFKKGGRRLEKDMIIPDGVKIQIEKPSILFYPDGTIEGKNIYITGFNNKVNLIINNTIGRITLIKDEQ